MVDCTFSTVEKTAVYLQAVKDAVQRERCVCVFVFVSVFFFRYTGSKSFICARWLCCVCSFLAVVIPVPFFRKR